MRLLLQYLIRITAGTSGLIVLLGIFVLAAVWSTIPAPSAVVRVPGLLGPVSVSLDADAVPRVHASSDLDAATALGFLHARERLFQMELMRRAASGRLSEIAGPSTVKLDRMMRTLGLRRHAVADLESLPADTRAVLEAYARGVNAWIALQGRFAALEFLVLGEPEPWQPVDSLLWAKTMGLWLSMNWRQELARWALSDKVSPALLDQLWPRHDSTPSAEAWLRPDLAGAAERVAAGLPAIHEILAQAPTASNEWAVDGKHSATGAPLLAGDPHLALAFPGIWYLARIETPSGVLVGATAPGVPFLVLGHNGRIAWSFTTTGADVQDIFLETAVGPASYDTPDGPRPFTIREERIGVRGQPDQLLTVRETWHGPVISDLEVPNDPVMAVAMGNLQTGDMAAAGLYALNRATSVEQAGIAAAQITSPVQNLMVADRHKIGLFVTGRVPTRKRGDGSAPVPGDGSHDWIGWAAGADLPHVVAPAHGRLVNANEPIVLPTPSPFMGRDTFGPWRADRIRMLLDRSDMHTAAEFALMQSDDISLFARHVLPRLVSLVGVEGVQAKALDLLRRWDGRADRSQPQPLIFNAWMSAFYDSVLRHVGLKSGLGAPAADFISSALTQSAPELCGGDCDELLRQSLTEAVKALRQRFGDDPTAWQWGQAHVAVFSHPMIRALPMMTAFGTGSVPVSGDDDTVGRAGYDDSFRAVHGPSFRGVYDLADLDHSLFVVAPGQSGNIFSPHAWDFLLRWRNGSTITIGPTAMQERGSIRLDP